jgi:hypothetical protein
MPTMVAELVKRMAERQSQQRSAGKFRWAILAIAKASPPDVCFIFSREGIEYNGEWVRPPMIRSPHASAIRAD